MMLAIILDTFKDTLVTVPFLLVVYLLLGFLEGRLAPAIQPSSIGWAGPFVGALAGCIPQCGFSAASAALYNGGLLGAGHTDRRFFSHFGRSCPYPSGQSWAAFHRVGAIDHQSRHRYCVGIWFLSRHRQASAENKSHPRSDQ